MKLTTRTTSRDAGQAAALVARMLHTAAVVATLLVALLLGLALLPKAWGWSSLVVTSGSMEPAFGPGDIVLVQPRDATSLRPMDIATFTTADGTQVTHRITDKVTDLQGTSFLTKGDANEGQDPWVVDARNVSGQVRYSVPRIGYVVAWARTPWGLAVLALGLLYVATGGRHRRGAPTPGPQAGADDDDARDEPETLVHT